MFSLYFPLIKSAVLSLSLITKTKETAKNTKLVYNKIFNENTKMKTQLIFVVSFHFLILYIFSMFSCLSNNKLTLIFSKRNVRFSK